MSIQEKRLRALIREILNFEDQKKYRGKAIISEGGAAGHLMHLYENPNLTLGEIKNILKNASNGKLERATEKLDGMNLVFTWNNSDFSLRVARNAGDIKSGGMSAQDLAQKFEGRGGIEEAFNQAYQVLEESITALNSKDIKEIFGEAGDIWYSIEVIYSKNPNVIHYDSNVIVIHDSPVFETSNGKIENLGADPRAKLLSEKVDNMQNKISRKDWSIHGPALVAMKDISDGKALSSALNKIDSAMSRAGVDETSTIQDYTVSFIKNMDELQGLSDNIATDVAKRISKTADSLNLRDLKKKYPLKKDEIDLLVKSEKSILKKALAPLDKAIGDFAIKVLEGLESVFIADNPAEVSRLQDATSEAIDALMGSGDPASIDFLQTQLKRLGSVKNIKSAMEGIVFIYGGNAYKFTGAFASANQILGYLRYKK